MDSFRKMLYGVLGGFILLLFAWVLLVTFWGCGLSLSNCPAARPRVERTPIPTLIPATLPARAPAARAVAFNKCQVAAVDLIGAWVSAGYSETQPFTFTDVQGLTCEATFKDVQPLFLESSLWYPGALACASCHHANVASSSARLDLSTYQGMRMGARRSEPAAKGEDIFGGGVWEQSLLYQTLFAPGGQTPGGRPLMPLGRPPDVPAAGPLVYAGTPLAPPSSATPPPSPASTATP